MFDVLKNQDFRKVRRKCLENLDIVGGISLSEDVEDKINKANDLYDLFDVTCRCKSHWNWMNIRVIEKMASNCSEAEQLIDQYKDEVFSRKVKDVVSEIPNLEVPADKYTEVKEKWNKKFDDLRIKDVVKRWDEIEKILKAEGIMLIKSISTGCVEICWLLPNDIVKDAIRLATSSQPRENGDQSATIHQAFLSESLSFQIGDVIIKESKL